MSQAIDYRLQKNPIVHHIANIYSSSIICAKRECDKMHLYTVCDKCASQRIVCTGNTFALGILRKPFHSSVPSCTIYGSTAMWEKASSLSMSKKRKSPKTLHLQVTMELTELKSTLGDVQTSLTSSLASIQGDINSDVLIFYVFSRYSKVMCRCFNVRSIRP